jgi:hypothetical protein
MADFRPAYTLVVHVEPPGTNRVRVTDSFGQGTNCYSICSFTFPEGEMVELRALPDADMNFDYWFSGDWRRIQLRPTTSPSTRIRSAGRSSARPSLLS